MKHSKYKRIHLLVSVILSFSFGGLILQAQDQEAQTLERVNEAKAWMQEPLDVVRINNGRKSKNQLVEIVNGQVFFRVGQLSGEIAIPLDQLGSVIFQVEYNQDYNTAVSMVGQEQFDYKQLDILRERNYPMVRFLKIPAKNTNFNDAVRKLFEGLIQLESYDEALLLLEKFDLKNLNPEFEALAIQLAAALTKNELYDLATQAIKRISLESINEVNLDSVMKVAEIMRDRKKYEAAKDLYDQLAKKSDITNLSPKYWSYYCGIYLNLYQEDHLFRQKVDQIKPGDALFSLQQLILGSYYLHREQYDLAMKSISEGIAYARPTDPWADELMYRSGQAYEGLGESEIAAAVYDETTRFFPSSDWAKLARDAYERIQL